MAKKKKHMGRKTVSTGVAKHKPNPRYKTSGKVVHQDRDKKIMIGPKVLRKGN